MELKTHKKTALILGATELVGRKCLLQLLQHDAYQKVVLLLEEPLDFEHSKLEIHQVLFEKLERYQHLMKVDDVYYTWGSQMKIAAKSKHYKAQQTYAYDLANLSQLAGAKQFIFLSSIAADLNNVLYYRQEKKDLEIALSKINFWATHIFQPGPILEEDKSSRGTQLVNKLANRLNNLAGGQLSKYKPIDSFTIAKAMIKMPQRFQAGIHIYSAEFLQEFSKEQEQGLSKNHG
ncbi:MAG: oxidoreductase [Saprospiraceae bacterium]